MAPQAGVERRILVIIETILKAESAIAGLVKLEATLTGIASAMKSAGIDAGLEKIAEAAMNVGVARQGLEGLAAGLKTTAEAVPPLVAGTAQAASETASLGQRLLDLGQRALPIAKKAFAWLREEMHPSYIAMKLLQKGISALSVTLGLLQRVAARVLRPILSLGKAVLNLINPLTLARFALNQFFRVIRIATALLLFQALRKLEDVFMRLADAIFGANVRLEHSSEIFRALIPDAERAAGYLDAVRETAIRTGFGLDELAEATRRFAAVSGKNFQAFQSLLNNVVALAFWDPEQGLHGAGMAVMEALEGNFRSLVRRFEIGSLQIVQSMRAMGKTNFEILQEMLDDWNVNEALVSRVSQTFTMAFRQSMAILKEFGRLLGEPIFDYLRDGLMSVRDWLFANREALSALGKAFGTVLIRPIQDIAKVFLGLTETWTPEDFYQWGENLLYGLAEGIISGMEYVITAIVAIAQVIADFLMAFSAPKKGPLRGIYEGGMNLIREWIRGMEAADLGAITTLADHALAAFNLMIARGSKQAENLVAFGKDVYQYLTQAISQIKETGQASQEVLNRLSELFGELYIDLDKYLDLYTRIEEAADLIALREEEVEIAEAAVERQEDLINLLEKERDLAAENLEYAQAQLEAFRDRTEGIPARFIRQRERELEMVVKTAEAEVEERERRIDAAKDELDFRRQDLEIAQEVLSLAQEQVQALQDQLDALEAQMNFMERIWALERKTAGERERAGRAAKALKDALGEIGIEPILDQVGVLGDKINELADVYIARLDERLAPLRERWDEIIALMTGFFSYEPGAYGLAIGIKNLETAIGRDLTDAEIEAFIEGRNLRNNFDLMLASFQEGLTIIGDFAKGFFGIGEGESEAFEAGVDFRKEVDKFVNETLIPALETIADFTAGILGIGEAEEGATTGAYSFGKAVRETWTKVIEKLEEIKTWWSGLPEPLRKLLMGILILQITTSLPANMLIAILGSVLGAIGIVKGGAIVLAIVLAVGVAWAMEEKVLKPLEGWVKENITTPAMELLWGPEEYQEAQGFVDTFGNLLQQTSGDWEKATALWETYNKTATTLILKDWEDTEKELIGQSLIPDLIQAIEDEFDKLPPKMLKAGKDIMTKLILGISSKLSALSLKISQVVDYLIFWDDIPGFFESFLSTGKDIIQKLIDGIGDMLESLGTKISEIVSKLKFWEQLDEGGKTIFERAYDMGKAFLQAIIDGITALWQTFLDLLEDITDLLPSSLAKTGPFSVPIKWSMIYENLDPALQELERRMGAGLVGFEGAEGLGGRMAGGLQVLEVNITNEWDASISGSDRVWLKREIGLATYNTLTRAFREARVLGA